MVTEWSIVEVVTWINRNFGIIGAEKVYVYELIQQQERVAL